MLFQEATHSCLGHSLLHSRLDPCFLPLLWVSSFILLFSHFIWVWFQSWSHSCFFHCLDSTSTIILRQSFTSDHLLLSSTSMQPPSFSFPLPLLSFWVLGLPTPVCSSKYSLWLMGFRCWGSHECHRWLHRRVYCLTLLLPTLLIILWSILNWDLQLGFRQWNNLHKALHPYSWLSTRLSRISHQSLNRGKV